MKKTTLLLLAIFCFIGLHAQFNSIPKKYNTTIKFKPIYGLDTLTGFQAMSTNVNGQTGFFARNGSDSLLLYLTQDGYAQLWNSNDTILLDGNVITNNPFQINSTSDTSLYLKSDTVYMTIGKTGINWQGMVKANTFLSNLGSYECNATIGSRGVVFPVGSGNYSLINIGGDGASPNSIDDQGSGNLRFVWMLGTDIDISTSAVGVLHSFGSHQTMSGDINHSAILFGSYDTITQGAYNVVGGNNNRIYGVIGGSTYEQSNRSSVFAGGNNYLRSCPDSYIIGGRFNKSVYSRQVGITGNNNEIYNSIGSAIVHSENSIIGDSTYGDYSDTKNTRCIIVGGTDHIIGDSTTTLYSGILAGRDCGIESDYSGIYNSYLCNSMANYTTVLGMNSITATKDSTVYLKNMEADGVIDAGEVFSEDFSVSSNLYAVPTTDLVTNGGFSADANWTKETGWTISGGKANFTWISGSNRSISQAFTVEPGNYYYITLDVVVNQGSVRVRFRSNSTYYYDIKNTGTYKFKLFCGTGATGILIADNGNLLVPATLFNGSIDNVTLQRYAINTYDTDSTTVNMYTKINDSLFVEEYVKADSFIAIGETYADYVFKPDYKLLPFKDQVSFYRTNSHLPSLKTTGKYVNLQARQEGIVEELEKLYIYTENIYNENDSLKNEIIELKLIINELKKTNYRN